MFVAEWPDWRGETAIIVATGPSASDAPLELAKGKARVIAIKTSWKLAPWADVVYGCDRDWWSNNRGLTEFKGLRITASPSVAKVYGLNLVKLFPKAVILAGGEAGKIGCGSRYGNGHSGFHAINLAVQFGAKRLILVGFDMSFANGWHWHEEINRITRPTPGSIGDMAKQLDDCAEQFVRLGVEVINCSATSALQKYPKQELEDAL